MNATAVAAVGGWPEDIVAPSAIAFSPNNPTPRPMSVEEIDELKSDFVSLA